METRAYAVCAEAVGVPSLASAAAVSADDAHSCSLDSKLDHNVVLAILASQSLYHLQEPLASFLDLVDQAVQETHPNSDTNLSRLLVLIR